MVMTQRAHFPLLPRLRERALFPGCSKAVISGTIEHGDEEPVGAARQRRQTQS
jgi:hypothetical protein